MKTYLTFWFDSEGASPIVIVEKLKGLGFTAVKGEYDFVYDWGRKVELEEILQISTALHETLKGLRVLYKFETI